MKEFLNTFKRALIVKTNGGVAGSSIAFTINGKRLKGKCINRLKKGDCLAMLASDGQWYLVGDKTPQISNKQVIQYRVNNPKKRKEDNVLPFKVLFTVETDTHLDFYVGGHVKNPILIHQIELNQPIYNIYAVIQNKELTEFGYQVHIKYEYNLNPDSDTSLNTVVVVNIDGQSKSEFVLDADNSKYFIPNVLLKDTFGDGGVIENNASLTSAYSRFYGDERIHLNNNRKLFLFYKNNLICDSNFNYIYNPIQTQFSYTEDIQSIPTVSNNNFGSNEIYYNTNLDWETQYYYLLLEGLSIGTTFYKQITTQGKAYSLNISDNKKEEYLSEVSDTRFGSPLIVNNSINLIGSWAANISSNQDSPIYFQENNASTDRLDTNVSYGRVINSIYQEDLIYLGENSKIVFDIETEDYAVERIDLKCELPDKSIDLLDKESYSIIELDIEFNIPQAVGVEHIVQSRYNYLALWFYDHELYFDNDGDIEVRRLSRKTPDSENKFSVYKLQDGKYYQVSGYLIPDNTNLDYFTTTSSDGTIYNYKMFVEEILELDFCFYASSKGVFAIMDETKISLSAFTNLLGVDRFSSYHIEKPNKQFIYSPESSFFGANNNLYFNAPTWYFYHQDLHWKIPCSYASSVKRRLERLPNRSNLRKIFLSFNLNKLFINTTILGNKFLVSQQQNAFKTTNTKNYVETWQITDAGNIEKIDLKQYPIYSLKSIQANIYSVSFYN